MRAALSAIILLPGIITAAFVLACQSGCQVYQNGVWHTLPLVESDYRLALFWAVFVSACAGLGVAAWVMSEIGNRSIAR